MPRIKLKDYLFALAIVLYCYLFYQQTIGINLFIFNIFLLFILTRELPITQWSWQLWASITGCMLSSILVVIINSDLTVFASITSTILLIGYTLHHKCSFFISLMSGTYSILASPFVNLVRRINHQPKEVTTSRSGSTSELRLLKFATYFLPLLIAFLFLSLYASASPIFSNLLQDIDLNFISWPIIRFSSGGFILLFGVFYAIRMQGLGAWDASIGNSIIRNRSSKVSEFHPLALKYEMRTGVILLTLLNALLIVFNILDVNVLIRSALPAGVSYSEYVHQGIYTLIISIVLAILIILYFFRGNLNFLSKNSLLLTLTYIWIIQNIILAMGIAYKNALYIEEYSLTYKRIGVFIYLFLATAGLLTTYLKTINKKNHWYLIRKNTWIAYCLLIAMSFIDWDSIITRINLTKGGEVDYEYLLQLSDTNTPLLIEYIGDDPTYKTRLSHRKDQISESVRKAGWQSWNLRSERTLTAIK